MPVAVGGRSHRILLLKEFDKMRGIGEGAFVADLRDGFRGRDEQQACVHQSLTDVPFVRRHLEVAPELLFERGQRTVRQLGKFLDRDVVEDVVVNDLFEILAGRIDVAQDLAFQTAVLVGDEQVDQFGHFDVLGRFVVQEVFVAQIVVGVGEKAADGVPAGHGDMGVAAAVLARMFVGNVQTVSDIQMQQNALQIGRGVVEENLLVGLSVIGYVLHIMMTYTQIKDIAAGKFLAGVPVVEVLRSAEHEPDCITRKILRLDSVV